MTVAAIPVLGDEGTAAGDLSYYDVRVSNKLILVSYLDICGPVGT